MRDPVVDLLAAAWSSLADLCATLDPAQWDTPTDCPGWSVKDNISHIIGTERMLLGQSAPEEYSGAKELAHVRNAIAQMNEPWIEARRGTPGPEVLAEFGEVTNERLGVLDALATDEFDRVGWTPKGEAPYREFMEIRVFDSWTHEQDIRRALSMPGHLDGPVALQARGRVVDALPYVVGKKAGASEGSIVFFRVTTPETFSVVVAVVEGRARFVTAIPETPAAVVELEMDLETLCCLGCGRWDPTDVLDGQRGVLALKGDEAVGRQVVTNMNFMF